VVIEDSYLETGGIELEDGRDVERRRHRARGFLAEGDGELRIRTQDGQVRLRHRG